MPRVLLAWEGGAGRGHLTALKRVADALGAPAMIDAALCRMEHARELEGMCAAVFQGARLGYDAAARKALGVRTATWGEFVAEIGFRDSAFLIRQIGWWREVIVQRRIGLVVADFAPCALLAARTLGVASVAMGNGYNLPPAELEEFPPFFAEYATCIHDEHDIVAAAGEALAHFGAPPIEHAPEIYRCDDHLVRTLPFLDPYRARRAHAYLPPVEHVAPSGRGDEIFGYFSSSELDDPALVEALVALDRPVRMYAPGASDETRARLAAAPHIVVEAAPVAPDLIARRSRLMIHAAQHGTLCLGLAAGLPHVATPQHLEQEYHARKGQEIGILARLRRGADAAMLRASIQAAYEDDALRQRARAMAQEVRPLVSVDSRAVIRARLDRVMMGR